MKSSLQYNKKKTCQDTSYSSQGFPRPNSSVELIIHWGEKEFLKSLTPEMKLDR